ncbi:hypothetical protein L1987_48868 [Smallanthus sonchifolius]|uniref:Uncharacterized protein n=1 Tax=Smallanthus sonchifolius TaxID=185202 RepID=A0ACB9FSY6_9ASTR|nr:hypothetical protein L1987_48868 [Smallanthus sonchifolius]
MATQLEAKIAPSMLSSDFANLASEAHRMISFGADRLHMDIMVRLTFFCSLNIKLCLTVSLNTPAGVAYLDCHLMVTNPLDYVDQLGKAGASGFTFHVEVSKGENPVEMVLVMTVEPGFGWQKFMPEMMNKVCTLREKYPTLDIEVDGGLGPSTIDMAAAAGANCIVAGSSVFGLRRVNFLTSVNKARVTG